MLSYLKLSKFFLYLTVFSLLVITSSTLFPFITGKYIFFRLAVELSLIFFLLAWEFQPGLNLKPRLVKAFNQPLVIIISLFVLAFVLSAVLAVDAKAAFWSNYERGDGGFQMIHYFIFFLLLVLLFEKEEDWRRLFIVSLIVAGLSILYGLAAALHWQGFLGTGICDRFQATLGNPSYVAIYMIFSLFYLLWLWLSAKKNWLRNLMFGSFLLVLLFIFLLTQTRGAFLGLGVGLFLGLIYLLIILPAGLTRRLTAAALVFLIFLGGLAFFFNKSNKSLALVPFCPSSSRLLELTVSGGSLETRFWTWGSAIQGFKERPILGWGPENFSLIFDKYFNTGHFKVGQPSETWFDRAHSVFFDYLAETGIIGLLAYLGIFAVFYLQFFKKTLVNVDKKLIYAAKNKKSVPISLNPEGVALRRPYGAGPYQSAWQRALLFSLPIIYLVQALVLFDILPVYLNLFLFFAFAIFLFNTLEQVNVRPSSNLSYSKLK